jgi:hypothetical protein
LVYLSFYTSGWPQLPQDWRFWAVYWRFLAIGKARPSVRAMFPGCGDYNWFRWRCAGCRSGIAWRMVENPFLFQSALVDRLGRSHCHPVVT